MLPLPATINTTLLKSYLQQFLLPGTSCYAIKKKIIRHTKRQKKKKQKQFKTAIINMLWALKEKADCMQEQMGQCKQTDKNRKREPVRITRGK